MMRDRADIKEELRGQETAVLSALGIQWKSGSRTHIRCPFPHHDDRNPSWRWDQDGAAYHCTCGNGSIIDVVIAMRGGDFLEASDWCREITGMQQRPAPRQSGQARGEFHHQKHGAPSKVWFYRDRNGRRVGAAARYETTSGKQVIPWTPDSAGSWTTKAMRRPRPLYRLPELLAAPDKPVLIVEGEKAAGAAAECLADYVVTTSAGGGKAFHHSDWDQIAGRRVVIWPDHDAPGLEYAEGVAALLKDCDVRIVQVPAGWPQKWDLADPLPANVYMDDVEQLLASAPRFHPSGVDSPVQRVDAVGQMLDAATDKRPLIQIAAGHLARVTDEAEEHLIAAGVQFYRRGTRLVRPVIDSVPASDDRETRIPRLAFVDDVYMRLTLARHIRWERFDKRADDWVSTDPSKDIAATLNARYGDWRFPAVTGIIGTQTIRSDGSLVLAPGYDPRTGLILVDPPELPEMAAEPGHEAALDALVLLKELLAEFPFVEPGSMAVALSALITPIVRASLDAAPMHVTTAPQAGSGKSYVFDIAAAIALGQLCPVIAAGKTEDEMEKRLGASLMAGQPIISIDNVNGNLGGEMLCQAVERPLITPRILGKSEIGQVQNRATFFATGNNIALLDDMTRRAVICSLDSGEERPELRRFTTKPAQVVLADRGPYIAACLTVVRAYHLAGRPGRLVPLASFEAWSDTVRSALVWLGEDDPCCTMEKARENDPSRVNFAGFVHAFAAEIGSGRSYEITSAEMVKKVEKGQQGIFEHARLRDAIHEILPEKRLNARALGKWLAAHEGKISEGLKLKKVPDKVHGHRWYLDNPSTRLI